MKDPAQCQPNSAWFEFENVPLKWSPSSSSSSPPQIPYLTVLIRHWPVGVLYDHTTGFDPLTIKHSKHVPAHNDDEDFKLPWQLTLRFKDYPTKSLMRLDVPNACRDAWINTAKEVRLWVVRMEKQVEHGS